MKSVDVDGIARTLADRHPLWTVVGLDIVDSTNTYGFHLLENNPGPVVALARRQTAGRGTKGRRWFSESAGNLYLSIGFDRKLAPEQLSSLGPRLNASVCGRLRYAYAKDFQAQWPNDIVCGGRKLSGLLIESKLLNGWVHRWVLGLGLNIYGTTESWPDDLGNTATTLQEILGCPPPNASTVAIGMVEELVNSCVQVCDNSDNHCD
jgi:BirA family biotin operon repressor/biotin-[acetyl-CoA-carboxylase] ligase